MATIMEEILLRNVCRWEILEYLDRLEFMKVQDGFYRRGEIEIRLSETIKKSLSSIKIDETKIEISGQQELVEKLLKEIRFHFLRAGG